MAKTKTRSIFDLPLDEPREAAADAAADAQIEAAKAYRTSVCASGC